ncbi:MAG: molecular chaperone HtpG, partial [Clostridia bacterium]|nr:molecular chaperone HtpG [Clostridia bacterium]
LKFGVYANYGTNKDLLQDLLLYYSSKDGNLTTLAEYVERMPADQKHVYYACGESAEKIRNLPQAELVLDKGYELLYLTEEVDEFSIKTLVSYQDKTFCSVTDDDLGLDTDEDKEAVKRLDEENKELFDFMKETLGDNVTAVKASTRLKSHPVCFSTEGGISLEMEKILAQQPDELNHMKAQKVLELNTSHAIFGKLKELYASEDRDRVATYTKLLYDQALLIEGMPIEDPVAFSNAICDLM